MSNDNFEIEVSNKQALKSLAEIEKGILAIPDAVEKASKSVAKIEWGPKQILADIKNLTKDLTADMAKLAKSDSVKMLTADLADLSKKAKSSSIAVGALNKQIHDLSGMKLSNLKKIFDAVDSAAATKKLKETAVAAQDTSKRLEVMGTAAASAVGVVNTAAAAVAANTANAKAKVAELNAELKKSTASLSLTEGIGEDMSKFQAMVARLKEFNSTAGKTTLQLLQMAEGFDEAVGEEDINKLARLHDALRLTQSDLAKNATALDTYKKKMDALRTAYNPAKDSDQLAEGYDSKQVAELTSLYTAELVKATKGRRDFASAGLDVNQQMAIETERMAQLASSIKNKGITSNTAYVQGLKDLRALFSSGAISSAEFSRELLALRDSTKKNRTEAESYVTQLMRQNRAFSDSSSSAGKGKKGYDLLSDSLKRLLNSQEAIASDQSTVASLLKKTETASNTLAVQIAALNRLNELYAKGNTKVGLSQEKLLAGTKAAVQQFIKLKGTAADLPSNLKGTEVEFELNRQRASALAKEINSSLIPSYVKFREDLKLLKLALSQGEISASAYTLKLKDLRNQYADNTNEARKFLTSLKQQNADFAANKTVVLSNLEGWNRLGKAKQAELTSELQLSKAIAESSKFISSATSITDTFAQHRKNLGVIVAANTNLESSYQAAIASVNEAEQKALLTAKNLTNQEDLKAQAIARTRLQVEQYVASLKKASGASSFLTLDTSTRSNTPEWNALPDKTRQEVLEAEKAARAYKELNELRRQASSIITSLETREQAITSKIEVLSKAMKAGIISTEQYNQSIRKLNQVGTSTEARLGKLRPAMDGMFSSFSLANQATAAFRATLAGTNMTFGMFTSSTILAASAAYGLSKALSYSLQAGSGFEAKFERAAVIMEQMVKSTAEGSYQLTQAGKFMEAEVLRMAELTMFGANDVAEALTVLGQAGFDANKSMGALGSTLDLAAVGMLSMSEAADTSSNMMYMFNLSYLDMARITDTLVAAATKSNLNLTQLANTMSYAGGTAAAVGMTIEETAGIIGVLANTAALKGSKAGTALRTAILSLAAPTEKVKKIFEEVFEGSGKKMADFYKDGKLNFVGLLEELNKAASEGKIGMDELRQIFLKTGIQGGLAMVKNVEKIKEMIAIVEAAKGVAKEMSTQLRDNVLGEWEKVKSMIESISVMTFEGFGSGLQEQLKSLNSYLDENGRQIAGYMSAIGKVVLNTIEFFVRWGDVILTVAGYFTMFAAVKSLISGFISGYSTLVTAISGYIANQAAATSVNAAYDSSVRKTSAGMLIFATSAKTAEKAVNALSLAESLRSSKLTPMVGPRVAPVPFSNKGATLPDKETLKQLAEVPGKLAVAASWLGRGLSILTGWGGVVLTLVSLFSGPLIDSIVDIDTELGSVSSSLKESMDYLFSKQNNSLETDTGFLNYELLALEQLTSQIETAKAGLSDLAREHSAAYEELIQKEKEYMSLKDSEGYNPVYFQLGMSDTFGVLRAAQVAMRSLGLTTEEAAAELDTAASNFHNLGQQAVDAYGKINAMEITESVAEMLDATKSQEQLKETYERATQVVEEIAIMAAKAGIEVEKGLFSSVIDELKKRAKLIASTRNYDTPFVIGSEDEGSTDGTAKTDPRVAKLEEYLKAYEKATNGVAEHMQKLKESAELQTFITSGNAEAIKVMKEYGYTAEEAGKAVEFMKDKGVQDYLVGKLADAHPAFSRLKEIMEETAEVSLKDVNVNEILSRSLSELKQNSEDYTVVLAQIESATERVINGSAALEKEFKNIQERVDQDWAGFLPIGSISSQIDRFVEGSDRLKALEKDSGGVSSYLYRAAAIREFGSAMQESYNEVDRAAELQELYNKVIADPKLKNGQAALTLAYKKMSRELPTNKLEESIQLILGQTAALVEGGNALELYNMRMEASDNGLIELDARFDETAKSLIYFTEQFKQMEAVKGVFEGVADDFARLFSDAFTGGIDSFSDFADRLKDMFKSLIAELLYMAAKNSIMKAMFGGGGNTQGFWSSILNGFNSLGSLFGIGKSSGTVGTSANLGSIISSSLGSFVGTSSGSGIFANTGNFLKSLYGAFSPSQPEEFTGAGSANYAGSGSSPLSTAMSAYQAYKTYGAASSAASAASGSSMFNLQFTGMQPVTPFNGTGPLNSFAGVSPGYTPGVGTYAAGLMGAYYGATQTGNGGLSSVAGALGYGALGLGASGAVGGLLAGAGGAAAGTTAAATAGATSAFGAIGVLPVIGWIAAIAALVDMISGGKLFGTKYRPESVSATYGVNSEGGYAEASMTEVRNRSLFRGRSWRTTDLEANPEAQGAADSLYNSVRNIFESASTRLRTESAEMVNAAFTTKITYDKKGKQTGETTTGVINGRTYEEITAEEFSSRVGSESLIAAVKGSALDLAGQAAANAVETLADRWRNDAAKLQEGADLLMTIQQDAVDGFNLIGAYDLSGTVDMVEDYAMAGETLSDTYNRLKSSVELVSNSLSMFIDKTGMSRQEYVRFSADFVVAMGGIDAATSSLQKFSYLMSSMSESGINSSAREAAVSSRRTTLEAIGLDEDTSFAEFSTAFSSVANELSPEDLAAWVKAGAALGNIKEQIDALSVEATPLDQADSLIKDLNAKIAAISLLGASEEELAQARQNALGIIAKSLEDYMSGIEDELAGFEGRSNVREFSKLIKAMNESVTIARKLGATEQQLGRIRQLYKYKMEQIISDLRTGISDLVSELFGDTSTIESYADSQLDASSAVNDAEIDRYENALNYIKKIDDYLNSLEVSNLSPGDWTDRLGAAQSQFQDIFERAMQGDPEALEGLTEAAGTYLDLAKEFYGSGDPYGDIYEFVTDALRQVRATLSAIDPGTGSDGSGGSSGSSSDSSSTEQDINTITGKIIAMAQMFGELTEILNMTGANVSVYDIMEEYGVSFEMLAEKMGIVPLQFSEAMIAPLSMLTGALGISFSEGIAKLGISVDQLAVAFGVNLTQFDQNNLLAIQSMGDRIGVSVFEALGILGVSLDTILNEYGLSVEEFSADTITGFVQLSEDLGVNFIELADQLGLNFADVGDYIVDMFEGSIGQLPFDIPTNIRDELEDYLTAIEEADTTEEINEGVSDLNKYIDSLPEDLRLPLQQAMRDLNLEEVLVNDTLDDVLITGIPAIESWLSDIHYVLTEPQDNAVVDAVIGTDGLIDNNRTGFTGVIRTLDSNAPDPYAQVAATYTEPTTSSVTQDTKTVERLEAKLEDLARRLETKLDEAKEVTVKSSEHLGSLARDSKIKGLKEGKK